MDTGMRGVVFFIAFIIIAGLFSELIGSKQRDSYINRALIANSYAVASQLKVRVLEYYSEHSEFPDSNYALDLPEPHEFRQQGLNAITIEPGGVIHLELEGSSPQTPGHLFLIPKQRDSDMGERWLCLTPSYPGIHKWMTQCQYRPLDG